jgi:poly(3-hydroxybutyrate) depolymerase
VSPSKVGVLVLLLAVVACEGTSSKGPPTGTAGATAGATGSAGATATAGQGAGTAGESAAGSTGTAGAAGQAAGGSSPDASVSDGAATTSDATSTVDATSPSDAKPTTDASAHVPKPSAGCGKANPPTGARTIMTGGQMATFNVKLPTGYVATTPVPLGFGFHGFSNPACGPTGGECRGFADLPAVTVYMKSISDGWEQAAVLEQNIKFFQDVLALAKSDYCIDESRIFVAGVSSGGQFVEYLTCRFGDSLWQVTPVSASVVRAADMNCKGTPPILVIHGITDQAGGYGEDIAKLFAKRNGCSATPPAMLAQAKVDLMAAFNAKRAEHVCMDWDGCTANPVRFCLSSQITYSGLTHGWPMIGGMLIGDFQRGLP